MQLLQLLLQLLAIVKYTESLTPRQWMHISDVFYFWIVPLNKECQRLFVQISGIVEYTPLSQPARSYFTELDKETTFRVSFIQTQAFLIIPLILSLSDRGWINNKNNNEGKLTLLLISLLNGSGSGP